MIDISIIDLKDVGKVIDTMGCFSLEDVAREALAVNWAPAAFKKGGRRTIADLESISLIVLDIDDGCSLDHAMGHFAPYAHVIMTSKSHQKEKNGVVCDRFRVILRLEQPVVTDADFKATWYSLQEKFPFIDPACKDSSRFFYPCVELVSLAEDGDSIPVIKAKPREVNNQATIAPSTGEKGDLWKSTLDFLLNGAPSGARHHALVSAVGNMREQGYTELEVIERVEDMSLRADWTQPGLSTKDLYTISDIFKRAPKYDFRPKTDSQSSVDIEREALADQPTYVEASSLLDETIDYLGDKEKVKGDPSGIEGLDRLLGGGFRTGEVTVLMAQAKTGKNTLYHAMVYEMIKRGVPFGYASRELTPATEVIPNLLSLHFQENAWVQEMTPEYKEKAREALSQWPLYFAPGYGSFLPQDMEKWFRALKDKGVKHFLFDHFHYGLKTEDYESVATTIKIMKSLAKELDIHLNLIVQPRSLREGEKLSLATLRGGAAIGQALDNLLILERVRGVDNISKLSLEVARHKLAKLGEIYLQYFPETTTFIEVKRDLVQPAEEDAEAHDAFRRERQFQRSPRPHRVDS